MAVVNVVYFGVICRHLSRWTLELANTVTPSLTRIQICLISRDQPSRLFV